MRGLGIGPGPQQNTMKTLVAINNLIQVDQLAYANHVQFFYRLGKEFPNDNFALCNPRRMSIDSMRNFAGKAAVEADFDYLMFVDDDVLLPLDTFKRLQAADKDIIAGVTLIRGYPYHPMIFDFVKTAFDRTACHYVDDYEKKANANGLLECDAVGFSCCLIKVSILRKMEPPYFITGTNHTEDVYFCCKAKQQIPGTQVWVDTAIKTAHILGSDFIAPSNLAERMAFDEAVLPGIAQRTKEADARQPIIDPKKLKTIDYAQMIKEESFGKGGV